MGQRLVVQIHDGEKLLATAYYHWSGYTWTALKIARTLLEAKQKLPKRLAPLQKAIRMLQKTGATRRLEDYEHAFTFKDAGFTKQEIAVFNKIGITEMMLNFPDGDKINTLMGIQNLSRLNHWFGLGLADINPSHVQLNDDEKINLINGYNRIISNRNKGLIDITEKGMADAISWSEMDLHIDLNVDTVDIGSLFYDEMSREEYLQEYDLTEKEKVIPWIDNSIMTIDDLIIFMKTHHEDMIFEDRDGNIYRAVA